MSSFSQHVAQALIRHRWALFALAVVISVAAWQSASQLTFNRTIESVFEADDPLIVNFRRLKETFGGNEIVLAVYADPQLFAPDGSGIRRVTEVRNKLAAVPGVQGVLGIDQPMGQLIAHPLNPIAPSIRNLFAGYTHGADGQTVALACMLIPREQTETPRRETIPALRKIMQEELPAPLAPGMLTGEPVLVSDGYRLLEEDGRRLGWSTTLLLAAVIVLCFRSLRWVAAPIVIVQLTLLWTRATLVVAHLQLSMVSSMLTAVVTVIGIATVVHVIVRFREAADDGLPPEAALTRALSILALPILWACCTDAVGFGSLMATRVGPVQDFGLMMGLGSLLVVVAVALALPALALIGAGHSRPRRAWGEHLLDAQLRWLIDVVEAHPRRIALGVALAAGLCAAGVYRLDVETDFTRNFRAGSDIVRSYAFVEEHLGGAGVWDLMVPAPPTLDLEYLRRVDALQRRLESEILVESPSGETVAGLTKTLSLADAVFALAPALKKVDADSPLQAALARGLVAGELSGMRSRLPGIYQALYAEDPPAPGQYWLRVMLRSPERQTSTAKKTIIAETTRIAGEAFPATDDPHGRAPVTAGFFVLMTFLIDHLIADQWVAFLIATIGIGLMMALALRNLRYALVALVPNVLPILMVTGLMGWLGLKINMGAAMIAAVSMGLSIDSSIHYITSFQRARAEGHSLRDALAAVHGSVGRALAFATLALIAGFSVLCFSDFIPTVYFGALVSLTMLGGLAGNLIVLPLLLRLTTREG
ncbi:MAG: MMPL family transporter [Planctomycetales bacterium]|nr:MMPL family transporter [Planctomycetales bacterium]